MLHYLVNMTYKILNSKGYTDFSKNSSQLEKVQRQNLHLLLGELNKKKLSYNDFKNKYPVTIYEDWREKIDQQKNSGESIVAPNVVRYQPTSGSSGKQKWIPYTKMLLNEFDLAASAWVYDIFLQYPKVMSGSHYWSLSWLPNEDRDKMGVIDDGELFSFWKKLALNKIFSVPKSVALLKTSEQSMFATAVYLSSDKSLSLISVWSPSFLTSIIEVIFKYKDEIVDTLRTGKWTGYKIDSSILKAPKNKKAALIIDGLNENNQVETWQQLWPKLHLISCWDTALAKKTCEQLKKVFPLVAFQGKGLWSTEAVVTIPYKGNYTLAYQSHFYEFKEVDTGNIVPSWELQPGMKVMPVLSTGSGLLRYLIKDILVVDKLWNQIPCLTFQGRSGIIDLVGEKLDQTLIVKLIEKFNNLSCDYEIISLLACSYPELKRPYYCLLVESGQKQQGLQSFENELLQFFHYRLATEIKQLDGFKVIERSNAKALYLDFKESEGMIRGNIKPEAITLVDTTIGAAILSLIS